MVDVFAEGHLLIFVEINLFYGRVKGKSLSTMEAAKLAFAWNHKPVLNLIYIPTAFIQQSNKITFGINPIHPTIREKIVAENIRKKREFMTKPNISKRYEMRT